MTRSHAVLAVMVAAIALPALAQNAAAPEVFLRVDKGYCIACHQLPEGVWPATRADLGPRLEGRRMRELGRAKLRELIQDPTRANPDTVMPPYGRHRILEASEIGPLVEFLHALPMQQQLADVVPADYVPGAAAFDPELRALIEQNAAAAGPVVEAGRKLWTQKFNDGRSLASCFPNGGRRVAATYPQFDPRLKRVITLETAVNQCLKSHKQAPYEPSDPRTMGTVIAYLRSLSNGQKVAVRIPAAAADRFEQGRRLYYTRLGQRNFACASCHVQGAGKRYADKQLSPVIGQATHFPVIRDGVPVTLQARMRECLELMGAAPFAFGSDDLNHLEYYLAYLSNGLPVKANAWRPNQEP